jgi:hypothetical protein
MERRRRTEKEEEEEEQEARHIEDVCKKEIVSAIGQTVKQLGTIR